VDSDPQKKSCPRVKKRKEPKGKKKQWDVWREEKGGNRQGEERGKHGGMSKKTYSGIQAGVRKMGT